MSLSPVPLNATANLAKTNPSQNTWDLKTIAKIALPIIASLAGFFLLPIEMAIVLTAVVTVGAIVCYKRQNAPAAQLQPTKIGAPSKIRHRYCVDNLQGGNGRAVISMAFQSLEEGTEFCKQYGTQFADCQIEKSKDPKWPEIRMTLKRGKSEDVLDRLLKIFPGVGVEE